MNDNNYAANDESNCSLALDTSISSAPPPLPGLTLSKHSARLPRHLLLIRAAFTMTPGHPIHLSLLLDTAAPSSMMILSRT